MNINVKVIPHSEQRYNTCGDWLWTPTSLEVRVSYLGDKYQETCIAIHEIVEAFLCLYRNITEKQVTDFDTKFEERRKKNDISEPGDSPNSPYRKEHCFATGIERLLASEFDINWQVYEEKINSL